MLQGQKNKGNLCYLDGQALKRNHDCKVKKKMKFSNIVEVLGDTFVGGGVCSLSSQKDKVHLMHSGN